MRVLIVTTLYPGTVAKEVQGAYRRLSVNIGALAMIADELEILHFVLPDCPQLEFDSQKLDQEQTEYWETPIRATVALRQPHSKRRWWHRLLAALFYRFRADAFEFAGAEQIKALEACMNRQPDMLFVHKLPSMASTFRFRGKLPHLIFDLDDVAHRVAIRSALASRSWLVRIVRLLSVPGVFFAERKAARLSARLFVCSDEDRRHLQQLGFGNGVVTVPNAVSMPKRCPPLPAAQTVLFLGLLSYPPNTEAAERLISRIWPLVQRQCPTATLIIAGNSPQSVPSFGLAPKGVEFTGLVDDLEALYARSRVICCPLTNGGGTRIKLIEAAGYGRPMVSTTVGAEGLAFLDGSEILIRDDDGGIAEACVRLLREDVLCARLGEAARNKAKPLYDLPMIRDLVASEIQRSLSSSKRFAPRPAFLA
jgi:glycosyltransferase involved in cell wall biosynthesis